MRRRLCLVLACAGVLFLNGCAGFKQSLFEGGISMERWRSSLVEKQIRVDDLNVSYLERAGSGETIVLLHGFSGNKDLWVRFARWLPREYRVIAIDLPGHGSTTRDATKTHSIQHITRGFAQTVDALGLGSFHLAGNSMGGYVSILYSAAHPDRTLTLCLVDSAGIFASPEPSDREVALAHGINPLVPKTMDEFDSMLGYAFHRQPFLPWPARSVTGAEYLERSSFNGKMWDDINANRVNAADSLKDIRMPVLLMWGDKDRIIHVSTLGVFQQGLPQAETVVFKDCGHMPMLETPRESARAYASFLEKNRGGGPRPSAGEGRAVTPGG